MLSWPGATPRPSPLPFARMRRPVVLLAALALLALPSAALAQSAGDEQYADPFGQVEEPGSTQEEPAPAPAPAEPAPVPAQTDDLGVAEAEVVAAQEAPTLPATGLPAGLLAGAGAFLFAGGATLRRRLS
jgi:hypothetical protein